MGLNSCCQYNDYFQRDSFTMRMNTKERFSNINNPFLNEEIFNLDDEKIKLEKEKQELKLNKEDLEIKEKKLNEEKSKLNLLNEKHKEKEKKLNEEKENVEKKKKENINNREEFEKYKKNEENRIKELKEKEEKNRVQNEKEISKKREEIFKEKEKLNLLRIQQEKREKEINEQNEKDKKEKESFYRKKEKKLKERENALENGEKEINDKNKQLSQREEEIKKKAELLKTQYEEKEKELIEKNEKDKKEKELYYNKKEEENKEREKALEKKEKELNDENNKLKQKGEEINKKSEEVDLLKINNEKREKELNEQIKKNKQEELIFKQKEQDIKEKEKSLEKEEQNLDKKKKDLSKKEEENNNKENQLNQKSKKLELERKNSEKDLQLQKEQLISWEKSLKEREDELINKSKPIIIGLNNIGATCYMNATLQCLSNSKLLTEYFLNKYKSNPNRIMTNEYHKVILNLWSRENNNKSYSPTSFKEVLSKENPLFKGVAANDSKDLINFLLERFHQELNEININNSYNNDMINTEDQTNESSMLKLFLDEFKEKFNSPISNFFYGFLETKSQCLGCNVIKYNFQVYSFLEFPLQQVNQFFYSKGKRPLFTNDGKNPDVDLYECFEYNEKIDLMTGDNQMYCNICNKLFNSYYSTVIYSSPIYLIINLNRGKGATYECKVNFPDQLNLLNYITFKYGYTAYGLYAVICHLGPSSMSGHFVAYCRNRMDNKWYLYNDAIVTLCSRPQQYNDGMPYILFYRALTND